MFPRSALTLILMLSRLWPVWFSSTAEGAASASTNAPAPRMSITTTPSENPGPKIASTAAGAPNTRASGMIVSRQVQRTTYP